MKRKGILMMYSIPVKGMYSRNGLEKAMKKYSLDPLILPKETAASDKFRKACSWVEKSPRWRNLTNVEGNKVIVKWTKVPTSDTAYRNKIQYDLMQQIIGGGMDDQSYKENPVEHSILKMFFDKSIQGGMVDRITVHLPRTQGGSIDESHWASGVNYRDFIKDVLQRVEEYDDLIDNHQTTELTKRYLRSLGGMPYRRMSAVWYIPEDSVDHAWRFQAAIREWTDGVMDICNVPFMDSCVDDVSEFFENELLSELKLISDEIDITGNMQDRLIRRLQNDISQFCEVSQMYEGTMDRTRIDTALEIVKGKMMLAIQNNKERKVEKQNESVRTKHEESKLKPLMKEFM